METSELIDDCRRTPESSQEGCIFSSGRGGERIKKPAVVVLGYKSTINNQGQTGRATLCIQIDFFKLVQVVPKLIDMDLSPAICSFQFPVSSFQFPVSSLQVAVHD